MSGQLPSSPNLRYLKNEAKRLLKQWLAGEPVALQELRLLHPSFELLSSEQLATKMNLHNAQLALARRYGFQNWRGLCGRVAVLKQADLSALTSEQAAVLLTAPDNSVAISAGGIAAAQAERLAKYERGRPYRENGTLYISKKCGLTLEEALNDTARIHDMPPVGTSYTSAHGIEWTIEDYAYFVAPTTVARYPGDCDYLPIVKPHNISQRLQKLLYEVDHCTSKYVLLLDTMPAVHPFGLGKNIHCANMNADPTEVRVFLDVNNAHETLLAHELMHLWMWFVEGMDGERVLRDRKDHAMKNQLDFIQSFVLDIPVNDHIEERGFDTSLIALDQYHGLVALRDLMMTDFVPPTRREPLLYSLQIAGAVLEQRRWPCQMQEQLGGMLEFFNAVTPEIYSTAMEFVDIVRRRPLDSREALRTALDECVVLGFRFTEDDFDIDRDLEAVSPTECMQDKFPYELQGIAVPLKLEIGKARARLGIDGCGTVNVSTSPSGMALVTFTGDDGSSFGPIQVNYRIAPPAWLIDHERERAAHEQRRLSAARTPVDPQAPYRHIPIMERPRIKGMIPDDYGRLPGDKGYNTAYPPGKDPVSTMQNMNNAAIAYVGSVQNQFGSPARSNATCTDQYGRLPGHPDYVMPFPPNHPALPQRHGNSLQGSCPWGTPLEHAPWTGSMMRYMAGLTRSIAEARLAQQILAGSTNLYQYAENNPVTRVDPTGLASWIVVGRWWVKYDHAYIQFNNGFKCNGSSSFGFWPNTGGNVKCGSGSGSGSGSAGSSSNSSSGSSAGSSGSTASGPGTIQYPDPHEGDGSAERTNNSPEFDAALCACIQQSLKRPPGYCFGKYVCGSWVASMWDCANAAIAKKRPNAR